MWFKKTRLETPFKCDNVKALIKTSNCVNLVLYFSKKVQKITAFDMLFLVFSDQTMADFSERISRQSCDFPRIKMKCSKISNCWAAMRFYIIIHRKIKQAHGVKTTSYSDMLTSI